MDLTGEVQRKNIDLLFEGYWYDDLPPVIDIEEMLPRLREVIENIENDEYADFEKNSDAIITKYKHTNPPSNIYNDGIETITFFDFKRNGALREVQIPNLKYYCSFVYNTMVVYDKIFQKLYQEQELEKYICNSNSYIIFKEQFHVHRGYDGVEEEVESGVFAVKNNKTTGQLAYEENSKRYLKKQASHLYSVKVDLESFYPNVYTHYLGEIKNMMPFKDLIDCDAYFEFLDYYNMKINNNQTKGILTGVFSSTLSAELLMLCVDYEINKAIGEQVDYIRYVDDLTFFSDSLEEIHSKLPLVQKILNKYRLRINNHKTEVMKTIYNMSFVDIYKLKKEFDVLDFDSSDTYKLDKDLFYNIKGYIGKKHDNEEKSEIKAFLTLLKTVIKNDKLSLVDNGVIKESVYLAFYMMQLACLEPLFASRCYKVIAVILEKLNGEDEYQNIIEELLKKNKYIREVYHDSILQIWHYYILSQYDKEFDARKYIAEFSQYEINPIVLSLFVKKGYGKNSEIMRYIKKVYQDKGTEGDAGKWKNTIMFSKWWLTLLVIYSKDDKDYDKFFSNKQFQNIYKDMIDEKIDGEYHHNPFD